MDTPRSGSTPEHEFSNGPGFSWSLRRSRWTPCYGFQPYADIGAGDLLGGSVERHCGDGSDAGNIPEYKLSIMEALNPDRAAVEAQIRAAFAGMRPLELTLWCSRKRRSGIIQARRFTPGRQSPPLGGVVANSKACNGLQGTIACQIRTSRVRLCRALR